MMNFDFWLRNCNLRVNFKHVASHVGFFSLDEIVGVVFHESVSFFAFHNKSCCHCLECSYQGRSLPVAFGTKAVAVSKEPLDCKAWQLLHAVKILEVCTESFSVIVLQEFSQGNFDFCLFLNLADNEFLVKAVSGVEVNLVFLIVFVIESVDVALAYFVHVGNQITDSVVRNAPAELNHCLNFVAVSNSNFTHVVTEADYPQCFSVGNGTGNPHPIGDSFLSAFILPVADNHFSRQVHPACDEAEFTVTVGTLVKVHKVHVHCGIRNFHIELGVELQKRLFVSVKACNPHFGRAECVAPDDYAGTFVAGICFFKGFVNCRRG